MDREHRVPYCMITKYCEIDDCITLDSVDYVGIQRVRMTCCVNVVMIVEYCTSVQFVMWGEMNGSNSALYTLRKRQENGSKRVLRPSP